MFSSVQWIEKPWLHLTIWTLEGRLSSCRRAPEYYRWMWPLQACRMGPWDVAWHCPLATEGRSDTVELEMAFTARDCRELRRGQARLLSLAVFLRGRKQKWLLIEGKPLQASFLYLEPETLSLNIRPERESTGKDKEGERREWTRVIVSVTFQRWRKLIK